MKQMIVILIVSIGLICFPALAQLTGVTAKHGPADGPFDLTFPGGTARDLVDAIKKAGEEQSKAGIVVNVLLPPELSELKVPPMQLRSVTAQTIFDSLNIVWRDTFEWHRAIPQGWMPGAYPPKLGDIWILSRKPDQRKTQAFYVGHLLKKFKIDDITTAVRTTWQLGSNDEKATKPELKYHQDTQLLIALADDPQLKTASEVLSQLRLAVEPAPSAEAK